MTPATQIPAPVLSPDVLAFAAEQGVSEYLPKVVEMTQRVFNVPATVVLEDDPEIANDWHLVVIVKAPHLDVPQALETRWKWHERLFESCPAPLAHIFRIGLSIAK